MTDADLIAGALWVAEHAEPEWANIAGLERELRNAGWSNTQAKRLIAAGKALERALQERMLNA